MYRKYIKDLFRDNKFIKGQFELGGHKADPKNISMPFLNVYATDDNIIPNTSTIPLNDKIGSKDKELYAFPGGHIGVFVGAKYQKRTCPKSCRMGNGKILKKYLIYKKAIHRVAFFIIGFFCFV